MSPAVVDVKRWQQCAVCGRRLDERATDVSCPDCGNLLEVAFHVPREGGAALRRRFDARLGRGPAAVQVSGVWRFREFVLNPERPHVVSFPEGNTPLMAHSVIGEFTGCRGILLKHEGMNPTGSFKDRGMTVAVTQARRVGARAVACASTGNTSASLAAYAALAQIPALVLVPRGRVALGKLTQTLAYGARTLVVDGDFDACLRLAREAADSLNVYLANSVNPFRIEGQKTIAFEILQQLEWNPPDWIALPAGNLGNTAAFGKAIREALESGLIERAPRLLAVQAAGAAPFLASYKEGFRRRHRVSAETVATAIRIGDPASFDRAVAAIRETDGAVVAVTDDALLAAKVAVDRCGIGCEPASAASVAGVRQAIMENVISPDARVVAVLTGHVLKDPGILTWYHEEGGAELPGRNAPRNISPRLEDVERALSEWGD